jgi:short-subunit dehydrogenase
MNPLPLKETVALVTGGSSGIGAALAIEFARRGADVVISSRRMDRLKGVADEIESLGVRALALSADVTRDGDLEEVVEKCLARFGRLDWVVANAGFGVGGAMADLALEDYRRQFETNVFGVLRTAYATWPALLESRGALAIIGSVAGEIGFPQSSAYSMSKAAVHRLSESLYYEFAGAGVSVTSVVPGYIESEIRQVDREGVHHADSEDPVPPWLQMPADTAARKIVHAMIRRRRRLVLTGHGKVVLAVQRYLPEWVPWLIHRRMARRQQAAGRTEMSPPTSRR